MSTSPPPHPAESIASAWHLAGSLVALKAAVDKHWPNRDKSSDGGIGDARHQEQGSASDHNPWLNNCVRAYDFTATHGDVVGIDGGWFAEQLRQLGATGDPRLQDHGYVIFAGHITAPDFSRWVAYSGADPHTSHVHVSVSRTPSGYEYSGPWQFLAAAPLHPPAPEQAPAPAPARHLDPHPPAPAHQPAEVAGPHAGNTADQAPFPLRDPDGPEAGFPPVGSDAVGTGDSFRAQFGNRGPKVTGLQEELNRVLPAYSALITDGDYGPETMAVLEDFQRRVAASDPHCPEDDKDALWAGNGDTVGPATARAFTRCGIKV